MLVGLCSDGVWRAIELAADKPERVNGIVSFAAGVPGMAPPHPFKVQWSFEDELPTDEGWAKVNQHYFRRDYPGFARFFFGEITSEPHSTKQIDDAVEWAVEGSIDAMIADNVLAQDFELDPSRRRSAPSAARCSSSTAPRTPASHVERSRRLSELTGAPLVEIEGADHMIPGRHPVLANLLIRDFVRSLAQETVQ